jgi:sulfite exporter TauE/SafE
MNEFSYGAALMLGLLGGSHCLLMCGGIGAALGIAAGSQRRVLWIILFQFGRIGSYTLLGAGLGGTLGLLDQAYVIPLLRVVSGLLLIAMGCYLAHWWHGLRVLEQAGQGLWRRVQPLAQKLLPVQRARDAVLVGLCWGLLPCGLIYSALSWSASAANLWQSAGLMLCFGLGTLPVMFATGLAGEKLASVLRSKTLRSGAAIILIGFGGWTAATALGYGLTGTPASPHHMH